MLLVTIFALYLQNVCQADYLKQIYDIPFASLKRIVHKTLKIKAFTTFLVIVRVSHLFVSPYPLILSSPFGREMKIKLLNYSWFGRLTMSSNERKLEIYTCLKCTKFELETIASSI